MTPALLRRDDPVMGRFLQTDPIGQKDDPDLYAYVKGDPANKKDPTGTTCDGSSPCDPAANALLNSPVGREVQTNVAEVGGAVVIVAVGAPIAGPGAIATGAAVSGGVGGVISAGTGNSPRAVAADTIKSAAEGIVTVSGGAVAKAGKLPEAMGLGAGAFTAAKARGEGNIPAAAGAVVTAGVSLTGSPVQAVAAGKGASGAVARVMGDLQKESLGAAIKAVIKIFGGKNE